MDNEYEIKLEKHIEALEKSYDNLIEILNEDIDKDDESKKIKLKDHQIKVYAEGVQKSAETANTLLSMIKSKKDELDGIREQNDDKKPKEQQIKTSVENSDGSAMNQHLN